MMEPRQVGVFGGTGPQGSGLIWRFAAAGLSVMVGSRDAQRGKQAAEELAATVPESARSLISGTDNATVAAECDLAIVAVPWAGHAPLLESLRAPLAGKIVVDCVNPLGFDSHGAYVLDVPEGSAAQQAAALLPDSRVVAAFHHVSAVLLADPEVASVDMDVLVLGDDREATDVVRGLAELIPGTRGVYAGRLRNAGQIEGLTANLISVNRRYKTHAGVKLTGL